MPGDGYAWLLPRADGGPVAFDACRPVHWVLRTEGEPPGGRDAVLAAVDAVAAATRITFVLDGVTDEPPSPERERRQPERYGARWAPVLVAWASEAEAPELAGLQVGSGTAMWARDDGQPRIVSGQLLLDREDLVDDGRATELAHQTALHEMAHVVGLGHVDDAQQAMHPVVDRSSFGVGDLRGLRVLGQQPCG